MNFNWKRLSVIGAFAVAPDLSRVRTFLSPKPGSVDGPAVIAFLRSLRRHVHAPVLLVWDRLLAHLSRLTRETIASQRHWLEVEWRPPYAPELNPVECLWSHLDSTHLANFAPSGVLNSPYRQFNTSRRGSARRNRGPTRACSVSSSCAHRATSDSSADVLSSYTGASR
jgi:transposase